MNNIYLTPPRSQKSIKDIMATKASSSKKRKVSKKSKYRKLSKTQRKAIRKIYRNTGKYKRLGSKVINVAEDKEFSTRSKHKQRVTRQQQRIINKRFKQGYSPFVNNVSDVFQFTGKYDINKCKWLWRSKNTLSYVLDCFAAFPSDTITPGNSNTGNYYLQSGDQSIYFGEFKYKYEIYNPTNIDMNLVIYDIVYKQDALYGRCGNAYYENSSSQDNVYNSSQSTAGKGKYYDNPIGLMYTGIDKIPIVNSSGGATNDSYVSRAIQTPLDSINLKPTQVYPFNIYCKVVRKHTYRLQPGATMTHTFISKPKQLFNRGYLYKYDHILQSYRDNNADKYETGIKDLTCGCLFKVWGQLGSNQAGTSSNVLTQSGKLAIKEYFTAKWYAMNSKYNYIFNSETAWSASEANVDALEVINNATVKTVTDTDMTDSNNNVPPNIPST